MQPFAGVAERVIVTETLARPEAIERDRKILYVDA
jgi:hypothetical protein